MQQFLYTQYILLFSSMIYINIRKTQLDTEKKVTVQIPCLDSRQRGPTISMGVSIAHSVLRLQGDLLIEMWSVGKQKQWQLTWELLEM